MVKPFVLPYFPTLWADVQITTEVRLFISLGTVSHWNIQTFKENMGIKWLFELCDKTTLLLGHFSEKILRYIKTCFLYLNILLYFILCFGLYCHSRLFHNFKANQLRLVVMKGSVILRLVGKGVGMIMCCIIQYRFRCYAVSSNWSKHLAKQL